LGKKIRVLGKLYGNSINHHLKGRLDKKCIAMEFIIVGSIIAVIIVMIRFIIKKVFDGQ